MPAAARSRRSERSPSFTDSVFINCPFDREYAPIFEAIVFCIVECGFVPRCALEAGDSGTVRLDKIRRLIAGSRFAVHDLSRVEIGSASALPRFNMPFELGLDLGCRYFGSRRSRTKRMIVLEASRYRYQAMLSDIAGQDIRAHEGDPSKAIRLVRDWLRLESGRLRLPGGESIARRFSAFTSELPSLAGQSGLTREDLQFVEYVAIAEEWLKRGAN